MSFGLGAYKSHLDDYVPAPMGPAAFRRSTYGDKGGDGDKPPRKPPHDDKKDTGHYAPKPKPADKKKKNSKRKQRKNCSGCWKLRRDNEELARTVGELNDQLRQARVELARVTMARRQEGGGQGGGEEEEESSSGGDSSSSTSSSEVSSSDEENEDEESSKEEEDDSEEETEEEAKGEPARKRTRLS